MTNLFSSFDPTTSNLFSMNWYSLYLILLIISITFWVIPSRLNMTFKFLCKNINKEISSILNKKSINSNIFLISTFILILSMHFSSLFPFIFPCTSQISTSLALALPLWVMIMIFG